MRATLIWSLNSLEENYNNIVFVRNILLKNNWLIQDDWVNSRIRMVNSSLHFLEIQGYDYLKVGIDGISNSDLVVFFFTKESSYLTTLVKYAKYKTKKIVLIYKTRKPIRKFDLEDDKIIFLPLKSISKFGNIILS